MGVKTAMSKGWAYVKEYSKRHVFHMVILVTLAIFGAIHVTQFGMIGSVYGLTAINKGALADFAEQNVKDREADRKVALDAVEVQGRAFSKQLTQTKDELNARIDILDSTIKPELKQRMLVAKVRKAILENTETKLTIRDLNNIAFATIKYSHQYNLSIARVLAQMKAESDFVVKAHSYADADGLMQVIPETWEYVRLKEMDGKKIHIHNVYHNIRVGCFYMAEQVMKFDSYDEALMAYNWGPHRVRLLKSGEYTEANIPNQTTKYVKSINELTLMFETYGLE